LFLSCSHEISRLDTAIKLAGDNKKELKKVLVHYSESKSDSLKYKAAVFLIENMPGHYTVESKTINSCREIVDKDTILSKAEKYLLDVVISYYINDKEENRIEDIKTITSDFLIKHIDKTFDLYNKVAYMEDIPFNLFLEYVLPYRFENERLSLWREEINLSDSILNRINYLHSEYNLLDNSVFYGYLNLFKRRYHHSFVRKISGKDVLTDCHTTTYGNLLKLRLYGIPAVLDFIPVYANRNGYHNWINILNSDYNASTDITVYHRRTAKIYRKTYSCETKIQEVIGESIPRLLSRTFLYDVTDEYIKTCDVELEFLNKPRDNSNVYLCVFNSLDWRPVAHTTAGENKAVFKKIGMNIVYLPVYFDEHRMVPINYPFILDGKKNIKFLKPDIDNNFSSILYRKYPFSISLLSYLEDYKDIPIMGHNSTDGIRDTIGRIDSDSFIRKGNYYLDMPIYGENKYRYYTISKRCMPSELFFFDETGKRIVGKVQNITHSEVIDNNPLTHTFISKKQPLVIDFGHKVKLSRIVCLPRSDGNGIYPDNTYELLYYKLKEWESLGIVTATDFSVKYDNIPSNALLWLRNLTTGKEERVFTIKDGRIVFW